MPKVDMSAHAVTTRLKRLSQLRRLGLALKKAKIKSDDDGAKAAKSRSKTPSKTGQPRSE